MQSDINAISDRALAFEEWRDVLRVSFTWLADH